MHGCKINRCNHAIPGEHTGRLQKKQLPPCSIQQHFCRSRMPVQQNDAPSRSRNQQKQAVAVWHCHIHQKVCFCINGQRKRRALPIQSLQIQDKPCCLISQKQKQSHATLHTAPLCASIRP